MAAIGGLIWDMAGNWRKGFAGSIELDTVLAAELESIFQGLTFAWDNGLRKVEVESFCSSSCTMSSNNKDAFNVADLGAALNAEDRADLVNALKNKLQDLAGKHSDVLENLTPNVRKRVDVLREIQACNLSSFN
ncbi:hypothetical protein BUALT_Bualt09G0034600 [Buddleja alternifolia]|uniref:RNase H type-1 domain-containing protein n=1 Tax=Buddleja alternifolia TaxID=168488 RepID=A0AAV6XAJ0_9LAMI|nr:hypothetical protein BUALT_Bualt09G0034600 [Buddleja alternifolia]